MLQHISDYKVECKNLYTLTSQKWNLVSISLTKNIIYIYQKCFFCDRNLDFCSSCIYRRFQVFYSLFWIFATFRMFFITVILFDLFLSF